MRYAHNKWTKQPFPSAASVAGGGFALVVAVTGWAVLTETPERVRSPLSLLAQSPGTRAGIVASPVAASTPARLVYRYSVLPGGVRSAAELALKLRADPVAAAHYAGFDVAAARIVRVEKSRLVHVSYRIGDNIYWTRNTVRLAVGEELISDGTHLVRARCGNRIADEMQSIMLKNEPSPEALDALMVSAEGLIDSSAGLPAGPYALSQAPTAQIAAPSSPVRLASNLQAGAPWPSASLRSPATRPGLAPAVPVAVGTPSTPSAAPRPGTPTQFQVGPTAVTPLPVTPPPVTPPPVTPLPVTPPPVTPAPGSPAPLPQWPPVVTPISVPEAPTPIPEPGSAALVAVALACIALARRRRPDGAVRARSEA